MTDVFLFHPFAQVHVYPITHGLMWRYWTVGHKWHRLQPGYDPSKNKRSQTGDEGRSCCLAPPALPALQLAQLEGGGAGQA